MNKERFSLILRIIISITLFQTLFFKFTGAPESVYIFSTLGIEPWGRIGSGVAELIAIILILYSPTKVLGALFSLLIISGAILSHLFVLGIEIQNDGGLLFFLANLVFFLSLLVLYIHKEEGKNWILKGRQYLQSIK
ncbi:MAG: DoxX family protein [Spirochaetia bacterium]|nr:DoxX family protein [Spirochaetia bacterium]